MSAVPKKKLCWNCEGNVSKEVDNCPYCGVYLQELETKDDHLWNPSYRTSKAEDTSTPEYETHFTENEQSEEESSLQEEKFTLRLPQGVVKQLKKDILPILLLMTGSLFFLFGTILFLFAEGGTLTLQWKGDHWIYFMGLSIPAVYFGWKFLQQIESNEED